jgi:glycosyltransferase involved in cell wall biosynthesis
LLGDAISRDGTNRRALILVENLSVPFDRRVWQECTTLRDAGWEVHVICPQGEKRDTEPEAVIDGVRIHRYPLRAATGGPAGYLREYGTALWHTLRLARKVGPVDVVHACNPPDLLFLPALWLKRRGARFVFDQHDLVPELYLSRFDRGEDLLYRAVCALERRTYRAADIVLATNESYRDVALRRGGKRPEDVFVVRSAPATDRFQPVPPEPELKRGKPHLLCYLGVMGPQDGVDYALRALAKLRDELGPDRLARGLRRRRRRLRRDGRTVPAAGSLRSGAVHRTHPGRGPGALPVHRGRVPFPDPCNPLNDVSTMNKVLEYMAMGRPIVSFDLREARVSAGDAAVYAPDDDEAQFAKLIALLLDDPQKRARMGKIGQERVSGPLSWENSQASLLAAYAAACRDQAPVSADGPVRTGKRPHH